MLQRDANATRSDAMRHLVLCEEIASNLDAADRAVISMRLARLALILDCDAALWRINRLPSQ
jgi:hypothetical protein